MSVRIAVASLALLLVCARGALAQPPPTNPPVTDDWVAWQAARPKVPVLPVFLSPVNGATDVSVNPTITVKSIGATQIDWYFGEGTNAVKVAGVTGFSYTPAMNLKFGTKYTVRVRGMLPGTGNTSYVTATWTTAAAAPGPPVLTCPLPVSMNTNTTGSIPVTFANPTVVGGQSPLTGPTCAPASGSLFPVGITTVTCSVRDALNRTATCTVPITVTYTPPQQVESPAGTHVPRDATALVDAMHNVWSFGVQGPMCVSGNPTHPEWCLTVINNNVVMAGYFGFEYQMGKDRHVYIRGDDAFWYKVSDPGWYGCTQGQPCAAIVEYYGDKPPDIVAPLPACRDGIDNDGDGKIDFGTGPTNDPGCSNPDDLDESDLVAGRKVYGEHDGKAITFVYEYPNDPRNGMTYTMPLKYRLYVDAAMVSEWDKVQVWSANGTVLIPLPSLLAGTHTVQLSAVAICQGTDPCQKPELESTRSLPAVEVQGP